MLKLNKRGLEISINTIIILIIAIVFLVLALGFVTGLFDDLTGRLKGFPTLQIEPTADEPISFIPSVVQRGKDNRMSIGFYNNEQGDISSAITPKISCEGVDTVTVKASGLNVQVGNWKQYAALVSVPSGTPAGQYSCVMTISSTEKTFFMEVQ